VAAEHVHVLLVDGVPEKVVRENVLIPTEGARDRAQKKCSEKALLKML
jgi:hypothetical protein